MNWRERYQQLHEVPGAAMSFHGRDTGGAAVVIHLLEPGGRGASRALLHELISLPPDAFGHVREIGEQDGSAYVITDDHLGAAGLEEWLRRARAGEDRYAQAGSWPRAEKETQEMPAPHAAPAHEPRSSAPGDFTRVFASSLAPEPAKGPAGSAGVPPVPPAPRGEAAPGDFTRVFGSPLAAEPVKAAPASGAGDITVLFRRPRAAPLSPAIVPPPPPPAPAAPENPDAEPGDFTRLLGTPVKPAPPAAPDPPPLRAVESPAAERAAGIGEYTRAIAARPPAPRAAAPPTLEPVKAAPRPGIRPIAVFATLAALALALILFFVLRR
jgi:hypothetical protein